MLELIAGIVEPGESDAEVALRESEEEAGVWINRLEPIATLLSQRRRLLRANSLVHW